VAGTHIPTLTFIAVFSSHRIITQNPPQNPAAVEFRAKIKLFLKKLQLFQKFFSCSREWGLQRVECPL
jgi:hypothetical protein